jgi:tripartite-type tricarboxylate transporter receptor subunit TctC
MKLRIFGAVMALALAWSLPGSAQFPAPGRTVTVIVPFPPGGGSDMTARAVAPLLERELGVPVEIANRGGAGSQVGMTAVARARPDGYTIGYGLWPALVTIYMDPQRQAAFNRASFVPLAMHVVDPGMIAVRADSPLRTLNDLVDAARQKPEQIRVSDNGLLIPEHLALLQIERQFGIRLAIAHFQGAGPAITALLGGHIDASAGALGPTLPHLRSGAVRVLALLDDQPSAFAPEIPTAASQGINVRTASARGFVAPSGTPPEVTRLLAAALQRAIESPEHQSRMRELGQPIRYLNPGQFDAMLDQMETDIRPVLEDALRQSRGSQ